MIGRVLGGRYEIIEQIDSGGMAYIYKALCRKTKSYVAIKVLKEKLSYSNEYVNRFKKEAAASFSLEHDHIVHVTDIGCDEGVYYMVMEFIDGTTLKSLIDKKGVIDEKETIQYGIQICSGLSMAHKRGIIHRDIKPQNILIDKDNRVKITDFGIAKSLSARHENESQVIGSVYYISPEQARGDGVDARTDIYSLGIMMYEMLTGELPYTGDKTVSVALKHINEQIVPPIQKNPAISESVNRIILKATSKSKRDRYRSVDALRDDLVQALVNPTGDFVDLPASAVTAPSGRRNFSRKFRIWKICVLAVLIAGLAVTAYFSAEAIHQASLEALTVPDVTGLNIETATEQLENIGLKTAIVYGASDTVSLGVVISQAPVAGSAAAKGDIVTMTVSSGPSEMLMPDVYNMTLDNATLLIEQMGLVLENVSYESVDDVDAGSVVAQSPEADSEVNEGDPVTLVVSGTDEPKGAVPQMTGSMLNQAAALLHDTGFTKCYVYEQESDLPEGTVTSQSPEQGILTTYSSEITLWVSAYKNKEYSGRLFATVDITEKESVVRIVVEDTVDGRIVSFVQEMQPEVGKLVIDNTISCLTSGKKTVRVLVNNEEAYTGEIEVK